MTRIAMTVVLMTCSLSATALSAERYEFFSGVRQNGMGGAYVAVVNDETALLSNPAALAKLRNHIITVIDPELSLGTNVQSIAGGQQVLGLSDPQAILNALRSKPDTHFHLKGQLFPSFVVANFGFGLFANSVYDAEVISLPTPVYRLDYTNDLAFVIGYSLRIWDGRIKIGIAARLMNRIEVHEDLDEAATDISISNLAKEGGAIAGDGGLILTAPWTMLPTLAATVRDIGNTTFNQGEGISYKTGRKPETVVQTVDVALAVFPIHSNRLRSSWTVEYRDVLTASQETDMYRRIHAGLEFNYADLLFLRGGMNQRYYTAGFEFAISKFQFQAATYGEEIGTATSPKEDRRYMMKFAFRF